MRKAITCGSYFSLVMQTHKEIYRAIICNRIKLKASFLSNSIFNATSIKLIHNLPLHESNIKKYKKNNIKENVFRENILEAWFENISNILKADPSYIIDWTNSKSDIIMPVSEKFPDKWPLMVLSYFLSFSVKYPGLLDNSINLIAHIEKSNLLRNQTILNVMTMSILFNQGDHTHNEKVMALYKDLKSNCSALDDNLCSTLIKIISNTPHWKDCFNYIEMIKITSSLQSNHLIPVMIASTKNDDSDSKLRLLNIMSEQMMIPTDDYFAFMLRHESEVLFKELREYNWIPNENVANDIKQSSLGYIVADTSVKNGKCTVCNHVLPNMEEICENDFITLKSAFMDKVFCKNSNVFINSSPLEIERFQKFCSQNSDFDVVIDALNVRCRTTQTASNDQKNYNLFQVIKYFEDNGYKVLVLSRKHIKKLETSSATWFFTDNLSADDTFGLFVALNSKVRGALYVSSDLLRDHSTLLGPRLAKIFKVWQQGHQVMFHGLKRGHPDFKWPEKHDIRCHIGNECIHIPYKSKDWIIKFELADKWLCIQRK